VRSALADPPKGEITVVVEGKGATGPVEDLDLGTLVDDWRREGMTTKEMAQRLRDDYGWKRKVAYEAVLEALADD
jgi:16S rRNA C1402 (ribose-2'-O) methylase RsmI